MKINPNLAISDNGFAFDPLTGHSYTLNPTALEVIQKLKQGKTEEEILNDFIEEYDVAPNPIRKDLIDFIEILRRYDLIEQE